MRARWRLNCVSARPTPRSSDSAVRGFSRQADVWSVTTVPSLAGVAAGLALGTKLNLAAPVVALTVGVVVAAPAGRRASWVTVRRRQTTVRGGASLPRSRQCLSIVNPPAGRRC